MRLQEVIHNIFYWRFEYFCYNVSINKGSIILIIGANIDADRHADRRKFFSRRSTFKSALLRFYSIDVCTNMG